MEIESKFECKIDITVYLEKVLWKTNVLYTNVFIDYVSQGRGFFRVKYVSGP